MKTKRLLIALTLGLGLTLASLWLIAAPLQAAPAAPSATCTVDDSGGADYTAIQDAVNDATCEVINVAAGEYYESVVITRNLTVVGAGPDEVSVGYAGRGFSIEDENAEVSISGVAMEGAIESNGGGVYNIGVLTLTNVSVNTNWADDYGGGIYNEGDLTFINSTAFYNSAYRGGSIYNAGVMTILSSTIHSSFAEIGGGIYHYPTGSGYLLISSSVITGNEANYGGGVCNGSTRNMAIEDSTISNNTATYKGGGIYNLGALELDRCQVLTNTATNGSYNGYGAGIWSYQDLAVTDSVVQGNSAGWSGGGIYIDSGGDLWLDSSTVSGNSAGDNGGGIVGYSATSAEPEITIANSTISGNTARTGGGLFCGRGEMSVNASTVSGNIASGGGGGILCHDVLTLTASTISGNTAGEDGGGICADYDAVLTLVNVTISGNEADDDGGGIYFAGDGAALNSVTIAENVADADSDSSGNGGGVYNDTTASAVTVQNTIIASNQDDSTAGKYPDCYGSFTSGGYNLIRNSIGCTGFTAASDQYGNSLSPLEPYLRPLGDYGGPTLVHALQYGKTTYSPAVDAGATSGCPATDQRGMIRPHDGDGDGNAVCDIGAYEYGAGMAAPDLEIVKTVSPDAAAPGERITYTLVFSNVGSEAATSVVITDSVPVGVTGASVASSGAALTLVDDTHYVWEVEDLIPGASGAITITGLLQTPLVTGMFTNTASIGADEDDDWSDNSSSVGILVQDAPPVASDATFYTDESTPVEDTLEAGEPNGEPLHYAIWIGGDPDYGDVFIADSGDFVYTPANRAANYSDTFQYVAYTDDCASPGTCADKDWAKVTLFITATNDAPGISNIANQKTSVGVPVGPISFIVGDPDNQASTLTLDKASSDTTLVPLANISFGGSGANRTVTVTPTTGLSGQALITVTVSDGASSAYDAFTLIVGTSNVPPDFVSTPVRQAIEDVAYTYVITMTDLDAGDVLTITAPTKPAWLTLTQVTSRTATLGGTPTNADVGSHAVALRVVDGAGASNTQVFTVTVRNVNDPPVAMDDMTATPESVVVSIPVLVNDDDPDGNPLSIIAVGAPLNGSSAISGSDIIYTPVNRSSSYDAVFTYTISDGRLQDTAAITVAVTAVNDPPTISDIPDQSTYMGLRAGPLPFTVTDPDKAATLLTLDKASSNTALVPLAAIAFGGSGPNRSVTVTPTAGLSGQALITITVSDGTNSAYDVFLLTVEGNSAPAFASTPSTAATQDVAYTYPITATDANAWDVLTVTAVTKPAWLALVDHHNRTATLGGTPTHANVGSHSVVLRVTDSHGATATQSFTLTVANVNDPPRARDDNGATNELTPVSVDVLSNDSDLDGDAVTLVAVSAPLWGSVAISGSTIVYTPANRSADYNAVFTYTISDGSLSDVGTVIVAVTAPDDPPFISNILNQRTNSAVPIGPIAFTVGDPDTPAWRLTLQKASSNETLVPLSNIALGGSGVSRTVTITPTAGTGTATITITVRDGTSARSDTFVLTVGAGNSPPDFTSTPVTAATADVVYIYSITTTDLDAGDALTITALVKPAWLTLADHGDGTATLSGTPTNADIGDHAVTLQVRDAAGATATQSFTVTVDNVNNAPIAGDDTADTPEDTPRTIAVLGNDADPDVGDALTVVAVGAPVHGAAGTKGVTVVYTPTLDFNGQDVFTYTISDGSLTDTATVIVTVTPVNDAPIANSDTASTPEDTPVSISVLANDSDVDGPGLAVVAVGAPTHGSATIGGANMVAYTPTLNFNGQDVFTYVVGDGDLTETARVTITVTAVNDVPVISHIPDQVTVEDTPVGPITFTVEDVETPVDSLVLTGTSSNTSLVSTDNIAFGGSGVSRTVTITPTTTLTGTTVITILVRDEESATASEAFTLTVGDAPLHYIYLPLVVRND